MHRLTVEFDEQQADRVRRLATRYGVTEQEVVRQLIDAGLDQVEGSRPGPN